MNKGYLLAFVLIVLLIAGCSQSNQADSNTGTNETPSTSGDSSSTQAPAPAPSPAEKVNLTLFMGPAQGTWAPIAHAIEQNLEAAYPEISVDIQPGGGSANVEATQNGTADLGMVVSTSAYDGWVGNAPFTAKTDKIRQLGVLFPMHLYLVVPAGSEIQSLEDVKGKTVNVGRRGSSTEVMNWVILEEAGITENDIKAERLGEADAFRSMQDGHIDLIMQFGATPYPPFLDIAATSDVRLLSMSEGLIEKVKGRNSGLVQTTLSASVYPNVLTEDVETLSSPVDLIVSADVDAAVVEKVVKALHDMQDKLKQNFNYMASLTEEELASDVGIPFHEGAERYYKAQGWLK